MAAGPETPRQECDLHPQVLFLGVVLVHETSRRDENGLAAPPEVRGRRAEPGEAGLEASVMNCFLLRIEWPLELDQKGFNLRKSMFN